MSKSRTEPGNFVAKYTVSFTARKGSSVFRTSATVECENERTALKLAEIVAKNKSPTYRDYSWSSEKITKK